MTDIHGNLTKWDCERPDPNEGIVCKTCKGTGWRVRTVETPDGSLYATHYLHCPDCGGRGKP